MSRFSFEQYGCALRSDGPKTVGLRHAASAGCAHVAWDAISFGRETTITKNGTHMKRVVGVVLNHNVGEGNNPAK
jgi:hypothetical protein